MKTERRIAVGFAAVLVCFLIVAFFVLPKESQTHPIVRLLAAVFVAAVAFLVTGEIYVEVKGELSRKTKFKIQATAGAALFVVVLIFWNKFITAAEKPPGPGSSQVQHGSGIQIGAVTGSNITIQQNHGLSAADVALLIRSSLAGIEQAKGKVEQELERERNARREDQKRYAELFAAHVALEQKVRELEQRGLTAQMTEEDRKRFESALQLLKDSGKRLSSISVSKEISLVYREILMDNGDRFPASIDVSLYVHDPFKLGLPLKEFLLLKAWAVEELRNTGKMEFPKAFDSLGKTQRLHWIRKSSPFVILEPKPGEEPRPGEILWFMKPSRTGGGAGAIGVGLGDGSVQQVRLEQIEAALKARGKTLADAESGDI